MYITSWVSSKKNQTKFLLLRSVALWALKFCGNNQVLTHSIPSAYRWSPFFASFSSFTFFVELLQLEKAGMKLHTIINFIDLIWTIILKANILSEHVNFWGNSMLLRGHNRVESQWGVRGVHAIYCVSLPLALFKTPPSKQLPSLHLRCSRTAPVSLSKLQSLEDWNPGRIANNNYRIGCWKTSLRIWADCSEDNDQISQHRFEGSLFLCTKFFWWK